VLADPRVNVTSPPDVEAFLAVLSPGCGPLGTAAVSAGALQSQNASGLKRLLNACPCLFAQLDQKVTARGVVHLCELTLGKRIDSGSVYDAFVVQHPPLNATTGALHLFPHAGAPPGFRFPPVLPGAEPGSIMEELCSEVLSSHGVPHMDIDSSGWPVWDGRRHVNLNIGKFRRLKLFGDLLLPAAPNNILISVKTAKARERFVVSGNRLESVGFGFFDSVQEFSSQTRMRMLKRWGFTAVYMPDHTCGGVLAALASRSRSGDNVNINGTPLYRPLSKFGGDMAAIAGKVSLDL
jgi:hypothetical protein